ncbi:MAG TPA: TolC family protein [Candidatus Mcinerneyibacteriales bacterium]|nr:TolC family protein [Candidatus Mcinerneyibacteriales bacterium]
MKVTLSLVIMAAVFTSAISAGEARLTVGQALDEAFAYDLEYRAAQKEAGISEAQARQASGDLWPSLTLESSLFLTDDKEEYSLTLPLSPGEVVIAPEMDRIQKNSITLVQPLFYGGSLINKKALYKTGAEAAARRLEGSAQDLILKVQELYWTVVKLDNGEQVLEKTRELVLSHQRDVETFYAEGLATRVDLLRVKERLSRIDLEIIENRNRREKEAMQLKDILGLRGEDDFVPVSQIEGITGGLPDENRCVETALNGNDRLMEARLSVEAARYKEKITRGDFSPKAALVAVYHYDRPNTSLQPLQDTYQESWEVGISLSFDLFSGGKKFARAAEAALFADRSRLLYEKARQSLDSTVRVLYRDYQAQGQTLDAAMRNADEAQESFRMTRALYQEGMAVNSDVLDAETAYTEARMRVLNAEVDRELARLRVLNVMGVLEK